MTRLPIAYAAALGVVLLTPSAHAHWCDDLWASSYNIVVKPTQDSVTVPSTGEVTLDVYVQNNMGYPLEDFALAATSPNFNITVSSQAPKKARYLLPGESLRHTLHISQSGGGSNFAVESLAFDVQFGSGVQDNLYGRPVSQGAPRTEAMMRKKTNVLVPGKPISFPSVNPQAVHLGSSVKADYQDLAGGISDLMKEFCAGRGSWDSGNGNPLTQYCTGTSIPTYPGDCPPARSASEGHTKYDYQHLWAAGELAYRKSALGSWAPVLRARLQCATNDTNSTSAAFRFFPYAILGYLGDDTGVRSFLAGKISAGTGDEPAAAKTALLLMGDTSYSADVHTALNSSNKYVQMLAAMSLGIAEANDSVVQGKLIATSAWIEPDIYDSQKPDEGNGLPFFAAHLLNLVAWSRRGWATDAADTGAVSFYGSSAPAALPKAPTGVTCTQQGSGVVRVSWDDVTQTVDGGVLQLQGYRTYRGNNPRAISDQPPNGYTNRDPTSGVLTGTSAPYSGLSGTQPTYFAVVAVDQANQMSAYSQEVWCKPAYAPDAGFACNPPSGTVPLDVSCDSSRSSDFNGPSDIKVRTWKLNGVTQDAGTIFSAKFDTAGQRIVQLTLVDDAGMVGTASAQVTVNPDGGNRLPIAMASANPNSGPSPLNVTFSSVGSSDPDGQALTYLWDFQDGTPDSTEANPTHTFTSPTEATFDVVLTVADTEGAIGTASVPVKITTNHAPDLANAKGNPLSGYADLEVTFDATGVTDPDMNHMSYKWSFGDQSADATGATAKHFYSVGNFTARLTVTDDGLPTPATSTRDFAITVHQAGVANRPPDCSAATVTPTSGFSPLTVELDATGCVDPDGDTLTITWLVPRLTTFTTDAYTDAKTTALLRDIGNTDIVLRVQDSAPDTALINRPFAVAVRGTSTEPISGGLGCTSVSGPTALAALALLALTRSRRRREG
jgi:PKD repeat protein